jgi:glucan phosphoethanolaminetransferase (alkaline phosphatase superfamily)
MTQGSKEPKEQRTFFLNYLYFGAFFVLLFFLQAYHVSLIETDVTFSSWFFIIYTFFECLIEVTLLAWFCAWIQKRFSDSIRFLSVIFIFVLLLCHFIDFPLQRLMDMSIWYAFEFVSQESYSNFIEMLYASNITIATWLKGATAAMALMAIGWLSFRWTERYCQRRPLSVSSKFIFSFLIVSFFGMFLWDSIFFPFAYSQTFSQYAKALPWKTTLSPPQDEVLLVNGFLKDPSKGKDSLMELDSRPFSLERKPDIYLFIVESLREDYITEEVAPELSKFRDQNINFPFTFSNANATQISWFSLFYSQYPFYWTNFQVPHWKTGSIPLMLLKKMGYEINVYSSSRLNYYRMDEMLLGENVHLADRLYELRSSECQEPCDSDALAMEQLYKDAMASGRRGGRLFIVFLYSTHFDYSWPQNKPPVFTPIEEKINYLQAACSRENLSMIKNRYKNALHYVDELFGTFIERMKNQENWDQSVVIFTADHGEEFNEYGHLFHASDLTQPQIHIPLYCKFGQNEVKKELSTHSSTCQMDIFPTIFHYLIGEECFEEVLEGESLFNANKKSFVIGARYNAGRSPFEFYLHNGSHKLILQFCNKSDIFHSRSLRVLAIKNEFEENIPFTLSFIRQNFGEAIDSLFAPQ